MGRVLYWVFAVLFVVQLGITVLTPDADVLVYSCISHSFPFSLFGMIPLVYFLNSPSKVQSYELYVISSTLVFAFAVAMELLPFIVLHPMCVTVLKSNEQVSARVIRLIAYTMLYVGGLNDLLHAVRRDKKKNDVKEEEHEVLCI